MGIADIVPLNTGVQAVGATAGALMGQPGDLFASGGETFTATLTIDDDASVPGSVGLLRPGVSHDALVQVGPDVAGSSPRKLCIKLPDAHGPGRDQDFLLASSGDGVPLHHAVLPAHPVASLYSSLWLYLSGLQPILFGARPSITGRDLRFGAGDVLSFLVSPPVGQFRKIGTLKLGEPHQGTVRFAGRNSGGNIWPLPPVTFY